MCIALLLLAAVIISGNTFSIQRQERKESKNVQKIAVVKLRKIERTTFVYTQIFTQIGQRK